MDASVKEHKPPRHTQQDGSAARKAGRPPEGVGAWRIAFLVFCTAGVLLSADLLRLHIRVHTDPNYHSYCAVSEYLDCEEVTFSDYAVLGGLPVALWGLLGYLFMGGLCLRALLRPEAQPDTWPGGILFCLSLFACGVGLALFFVSHYLIQSLCLVCTATYVVNLVLCGLALADLRRRGAGPVTALRAEARRLVENFRPALAYGLCFAAAAFVLWLAIPAYWHTAAASGPGGLPAGQTPQGAHWLGARRPVLEIVEFSDYQCPFCFRGHSEVRAMVAKYPRKIRLVHRHFPLRSHPAAFDYAVLAHCAGRQDRFWEATDYLFANGRRIAPVQAAELAAAVHIDPQALAACQSDDAARRAVIDDIEEGRARGVRGTPAYFIGDDIYPGRIPESIFDALGAQ